ncbi:MAG: HmuY family protein, partial [Myxococcota bacterium]
AGCSEAVGSSDGDDETNTNPGGTDGTDEPDDVDISDQGMVLDVPVAAEGRTYVDLDEVSVLELTEEQAATDTAWDLAFEGYDVFTNSGVSGNGTGGAFGPYGTFVFLNDVEPEHPFLIDDATGGAFLDWYAYEGAVHALWSRYHVYGVQDGDRYFKVQLLSYYGEIEGAPVSAIYSLRWAEVTAEGPGATQSTERLNATAGGLAGTPDDPSGCIDLGTGEETQLTFAQSQESMDWHICFRRDSISINGGLGGPRGVGAVDITRINQPERASVDEVKELSATSEAPAFESLTYADLTARGLEYRGDRIVSAFDSVWADLSGDTPAPANRAWVVGNGAGNQKHLVYFESFDSPTEASPNQIALRTKPVNAP